MGDFLYEQFKERVKDFGITIGPEDRDGNIKIAYGGKDLTINLENARRSYTQYGDLTHLDRIIASLHESLMGIPLPGWDEASPNLFFMLSQPKETHQEQYVTEPVANGVVKVFVHHHQGKYIWISHNTLRYWNVSLEAFKGQCNYNMDILLDECKIETIKTPDHVKYYCINSDISWLNSAMLFTKNFKKKIEQQTGWPVYFAMPTREFSYFVNIKHRQTLDLLSPMFADILRHEDLPLTREIFSMTDNGIRVVGRF
jgi:hypothetical protein